MGHVAKPLQGWKSGDNNRSTVSVTASRRDKSCNLSNATIGNNWASDQTHRRNFSAVFIMATEAIPVLYCSDGTLV